MGCQKLNLSINNKGGDLGRFLKNTKIFLFSLSLHFLVSGF